MIRFSDFLADHFADDPEEIHLISMDQLKQLVIDYLLVTLFQFEDGEYEDAVNVLCSQLDQYFKGEEAEQFYDGLLIDMINVINFSHNKNVVVQFRNRDKVRKDNLHEVFSINDDESFKESFLFVYNKLGQEEKQNQSQIG
jgi:hypothetical protein